MIEVQLDSTGLCGFSRCRAPLPGPGPKGGRPFAYCPDRAWPGGRTCKQLAAAQDVLVEALGAESTPLTDATADFAAAAERVAEPLRDVLAVAEALKGALAEEAKAAAERVERAEAEAATERGLREAAEAETRQAHAAAETAERTAADTVAEAKADARRYQVARDQAVADAKAARDAAKQADLAKARAEGAAASEHQRAEDALREVTEARAEATRQQSRADAAEAELTRQRARAEAAEVSAAEERRRADEATRALTEATATVATRTAERDAARAAERTVRDELARAAETNLDLAAELRTQQTVHDRRLSEVTARHAEELARVTTRLRDVLLDPAPEEDLRTRLLASLLDPA